MSCSVRIDATEAALCELSSGMTIVIVVLVAVVVVVVVVDVIVVVVVVIVVAAIVMVVVMIMMLTEAIAEVFVLVHEIPSSCSPNASARYIVQGDDDLAFCVAVKLMGKPNAGRVEVKTQQLHRGSCCEE